MNRRGGLILVALFMVSLHGAWASDSVLDRADPEVRKRLESLASAYQSLKYYGDEGSLTRVIKIGDREVKERTPLGIRYASPTSLLLQAGEIEILADGAILKTVLHPTRRVLEEKCPGPIRFNRISDGPAGAILLGGFTGPPAQLLLKLLLKEPASSALPDRTSAVVAEPARDWLGKSHECLRLEQGDGPPLRLYIDRDTQLIRRMEYILESEKLSGKVPGNSPVNDMTLAWDSGPIVTTAPEPIAFELKIPDGYVKVEPAKPKAPAEVAKNPLVDQPAPDFVVDVLDGPGKLKRVSREDLKGKIVILDFWATWCGPCLLELPQIQALAEDLERSKAGDVAIIAVSQDRKPEGGDSVRKLVEDLLDFKKLALGGGPISRVALDPDQATGEGFGVDALPTLVVIDAKGVVRSVHVGYDEGIKDVLLDEIGHLREGKPLKP